MHRRFAALMFALILVGLTGCGPSQQAGGPTPAAPGTPAAAPGTTAPAAPSTTTPNAATTITFWSTETQPERVAKTKAMLARFQQDSGISVTLVPVEQNKLPELVTSAAAAGTLPDLIFHPLDFTISWQQNGILNAEAATRVVDLLGRDTFSPAALKLVAVGNGIAALPSDGWGQLLIYRKDLFEQAGLAAPDSYANILAAARALHKPDQKRYGITAASKAGEVFTQQTFEQFALANNCQLVNERAAVTLDSPACVEAIATFTDLLNNYGPRGEADVNTTRATYFAGQAAMLIWSPFILDELAGLRDNALPTCPECQADRAFLAKHSGFVPAFAGPKGMPAQYGQISLLGITSKANVEASVKFATFWFNQGYLDWLALSPEGKLPMRSGTAEEPQKWVNGWKQLETGVDRKARLSDIYGQDVLDLLTRGTQSFTRWGFPQGQGPLVGALYQSLPVPARLREVLDGNQTPEQAAKDLQADVEALAKQ